MSALGGKKGELLKDRELFPAGDSVCDWLAIAMALSGTRESYSDYLAELKAHVEDAYAKTDAWTATRPRNITGSL